MRAVEEPVRKVVEPGTARERVQETHPAYGMLRIGRIHGGGTILFGSPIESPTRIQLTICRGIVSRELSRDWYHGREELVEVEMTPAQFAEAITNLNWGDGFPCTITAVGGQYTPSFSQNHPRAKIEDEFAGEMKKLARDLDAQLLAARAVLDDPAKKSLNRADRDALRTALDRVGRFLKDSAPFIQSQFNEAMDRTATEARSEVAAAVSMMTHHLGAQELGRMMAERQAGAGLALPAAGGDGTPA